MEISIVGLEVVPEAKKVLERHGLSWTSHLLVLPEETEQREGRDCHGQPFTSYRLLSGEELHVRRQTGAYAALVVALGSHSPETPLLFEEERDVRESSSIVVAGVPLHLTTSEEVERAKALQRKNRDKYVVSMINPSDRIGDQAWLYVLAHSPESQRIREWIQAGAGEPPQ